MFLLHFTDPDQLIVNYNEIYDQNLLSFLFPIMHYTSILSITFGMLLIFLICTKTPEDMKLLKAYLIPYAINVVCLELIMLLFKPFLMQPFFAIYSLQFGNEISTTCLLMLFIFMSFFAMSMIDCIAGMAAERYFLIELHFREDQPLLPTIIFAALSGTSFGYLIFGIIAVQFQSFQEILILNESEVEDFLETHIPGALENINPASIIIFRPEIPVKSFAAGFGLFVAFVFSRYLVAGIFLLLNAYKSQHPLLNTSEKLKRNNQILLRCITAQVIGFSILAALPSFIIVVNFYFRSQPNSINAWCLVFMNLFGLYDVIITTILIKPYRRSVIQASLTFVNFCKNRRSSKVDIPDTPIFVVMDGSDSSHSQDLEP